MGLINNYTTEELEEFENDVKEFYRQEALREAKDKRILHKQKRKLSPYLYSQLRWLLEFYETTWGYEIVQTLGENAVKNTEDFHSLRHIFTDIESGEYGFEGEISSGGEVWVPIKNGNYFKFSFGM